MNCQNKSSPMLAFSIGIMLNPKILVVYFKNLQQLNRLTQLNLDNNIIVVQLHKVSIENFA